MGHPDHAGLKDISRILGKNYGIEVSDIPL
jgi:hypothetical protein